MTPQQRLIARWPDEVFILPPVSPTLKVEQISRHSLAHLVDGHVAPPLRFWLSPRVRNNDIIEDCIQHAGAEFFHFYDRDLLRFLDILRTVGDLVDSAANRRALLQFFETTTWRQVMNLEKRSRKERQILRARDPSSESLTLPHDHLVRQELIDHVHHVLGRLPEELRTILILRFFDELTVQDIATKLGISVPAAKSRLHRAINAKVLKNLLDQIHHTDSE